MPNPNQVPIPSQKIEATVGHEDNFDIDTAISDKDFAKFLADHENYKDFDMGDQAFVSKKFAEYKLLKKVVDEQASFFRETFKNIDVQMIDADVRSVEEVLYEKALHSPEEIVSAANSMSELTSSFTEVNQLESQLKDLLKGTELDDLKKELEHKKEQYDLVKLAQKMSTDYGIGKAKVWGSLVGNRILAHFSEWREGDVSSARERAEKAREIIDAHKELKEKYGKFNYASLQAYSEVLEERVEEINQVLETIDDVSKKKETALNQFAKSRKEILEGVADFTGLTRVIQQRIKFRLEVMFKKGDLDTMNKAQEFMDGIKEAQASPIGMDMAGGYDGKETLDKLQDKINSFIEAQTQKAIENAVIGPNVGNATFSRLEKTLVTLATKEKMGTKTGPEIKDFIVFSIKDIRDKLGDTSDDKVRHLYLSRILIKLGSK